MAGSLKSSATPLVALIGRPNVGKSSLFNRLIGGRQAITHETAGTTRDANYGSVEWRGKRLLLVDTAGLIGGGVQRRPRRKATTTTGKDSGGELEAAVQEQVEAVAGLANVLVLVVDAGTILTTEDELAAELARKSGKPLVLAINKADTADGRPEEAGESLGITPAVVTSAIHGRGSGDLLDAIVAQAPDAPAAGRSETDEPVVSLALIGRPNVGKSSLLNALAGKQQAIVSERAGTTRDVGSVELRYHSQTIRLLDTAGLRRHGRIEPGIEQYSSLRTLAAIARADVCAVVMDSTEPSVAGDQHIAGEVIEAGKGLILVMNKWDQIDKETGTQERFTRQLVGDFAFAPWAPLVYTSATQGLNVTQLFALATQIATTRTQQLSTGELNRIISELVAKHPPAGRKNRQPKIKYVTQTGINPPTFSFFCSYPDLIHFSYVRYLENGLRERYAFEGTPIKLEFRSKHS